MNLKEIKTGGKTLYDGKILRLELDDVQLPDGSFSKREIVRHSGGAAVLLVAESKVLLVKQFRYAYGEEIYEIPAGKLNKGEDPKLAAARELEEETGYSATLEKLLEIYPTPGYTDEKIHIYLAKNPVFKGQKLDDGEFLSVEFVPLKEVLKMINSGGIKDSKTVAAVLKYSIDKK